MPRPNKATPSKLAKLRDGKANGQSLRERAKAAGVPVETARRWEARDVAAPGPVNAKAKTPRLKADAKVAAALVAAPLPAPGDPEALSIVRQRSALLSGLLARLTPAVESGEYAATSFVTLARYGDDLARVLAELTPPAPKDPDQDP